MMFLYVIKCHHTLLDVRKCYYILCDVKKCHAMSIYFASCKVMWRYVMWCSVMLLNVMWCIMMCNLMMASYHHLNPFLLHTSTITLGRTSTHHEKDDSQSNDGKSKGKRASTRTTGTKKDKTASPASDKNKPSPSVSRSGEKKIRKGKRWTIVVPTKKTPTLRIPRQPRNKGLQKKKGFPKPVEAELTMMLAKS